jgi:hypothetical protein
MTSNVILEFEQNKNWQATAKYADGQLVAVMRGEPGEHEGKFYLYEDDWKFTPPGIITPSDPTGIPYSARAIRDKFDSGELTLIKGEIPSRKNFVTK